MSQDEKKASESAGPSSILSGMEALVRKRLCLDPVDEIVSAIGPSRPTWRRDLMVQSRTGSGKTGAFRIAEMVKPRRCPGTPRRAS
jgi:hypothetical protein